MFHAEDGYNRMNIRNRIRNQLIRDAKFYQMGDTLSDAWAD
jgi:hypothetical protein